MKKNLFILACATSLALGLSSCAAISNVGAVYTDTTAPVAATSNSLGSKVGESTSMNVLGIVALGDASIQEAAKKAGIKKISSVDTKTFSVLGVYTKVTTIVTGE